MGYSCHKEIVLSKDFNRVTGEIEIATEFGYERFNYLKWNATNDCVYFEKYTGIFLRKKIINPPKPFYCKDCFFWKEDGNIFLEH